MQPNHFYKQCEIDDLIDKLERAAIEYHQAKSRMGRKRLLKSSEHEKLSKARAQLKNHLDLTKNQYEVFG
jgi:hypothetical protein